MQPWNNWFLCTVCSLSDFSVLSVCNLMLHTEAMLCYNLSFFLASQILTDSWGIFFVLKILVYFLMS